MSERRLYLDVGVGETRGVVSLDGRPERLLIVRDGDLAVQALGAKVIARISRIERAAGLAFLDLGEGPDGVLNLTPEIGRLTEGAAVEVEIRSEARDDKGASARFLTAAEGAPRLLAPGPSLEERLRAFDRSGEIRTGPMARSMADGAQDEVLQTVFALPGGGSLAVEPTRALIAVDVDLGARPGTEAKRAARAANFAALGTAARVLRLKGLGGLVVIDLIGRGHDGPALLAAARAAFGPDNPGVAFGPISRFGTLELTLPRRARPALDILIDGDVDGASSVLTLALILIRAVEREAVADGGGRFEAVAAPEVAEAAEPGMTALTARLGARLTLRGEAGRPRGDFEVIGK
ncbi:MAG: ribonuclease E/G, partial [Caulobacteraceae bacterium]